MSVASPALIGVDWGTSAFRAFLIGADGHVHGRASGSEGIKDLGAGRFRETLLSRCKPWLARHPELPILMCGMVGSRQGWRETRYVASPARDRDIAAGVVQVSDEAHRLFLVPGVRSEGPDGDPDVMRGEETVIIGALASGIAPSGTYCIPGTHSKWVEMDGGHIRDAATYLTGELFALLRERSSLSGFTSAPDLETSESVAQAFTAGVERAGRDDHLLHQLFALRARSVLDVTRPSSIADELSGILIGTEIIAAARKPAFRHRPVHLIASADLGKRYLAAFGQLGIASEWLDAELACARGLHRIAQLHGLIESDKPHRRAPAQLRRRP